MSDRLKAADDEIENHILFKELREKAASEHWQQLERTGMAYEFHPKSIAERAFIDGWLAALWAVKNAYKAAPEAAKLSPTKSSTKTSVEDWMRGLALELNDKGFINRDLLPYIEAIIAKHASADRAEQQNKALRDALLHITQVHDARLELATNDADLAATQAAYARAALNATARTEVSARELIDYMIKRHIQIFGDSPNAQSKIKDAVYEASDLLNVMQAERAAQPSGEK